MIGEDYKVSLEYTFRVPMRDAANPNVLQSGKSPSVVIYLPDGSVEANPPSISELGTSGVYSFAYTFPATEGAYTFLVATSGCVPVPWTVQVRSNSRDDLAAAAALTAHDGKLDTVKAKTDALPAQPAASGDAMTLTADERAAVAGAVLDEPVQSAAATDDSLRAAAKAAWAQGFGKWSLNGTVLSLYGPDGSTVVRQFNIDNTDAPTQRVPT